MARVKQTARPNAPADAPRATRLSTAGPTDPSAEGIGAAITVRVGTQPKGAQDPRRRGGKRRVADTDLNEAQSGETAGPRKRQRRLRSSVDAPDEEGHDNDAVGLDAMDKINTTLNHLTDTAGGVWTRSMSRATEKRDERRKITGQPAIEEEDEDGDQRKEDSGVGTRSRGKPFFVEISSNADKTSTEKHQGSGAGKAGQRTRRQPAKQGSDRAQEQEEPREDQEEPREEQEEPREGQEKSREDLRSRNRTPETASMSSSARDLRRSKNVAPAEPEQIPQVAEDVYEVPREENDNDGGRVVPDDEAGSDREQRQGSIAAGNSDSNEDSEPDEPDDSIVIPVPGTTEEQYHVKVKALQLVRIITLMGYKSWTGLTSGKWEDKLRRHSRKKARKEMEKGDRDQMHLYELDAAYSKELWKRLFELRKLCRNAPHTPDLKAQDDYIREKASEQESFEKGFSEVSKHIDDIRKEKLPIVQLQGLPDTTLKSRDKAAREIVRLLIPMLVLTLKEAFLMGRLVGDPGTGEKDLTAEAIGEFSTNTLEILVRVSGWIMKLEAVLAHQLKFRYTDNEGQKSETKKEIKKNQRSELRRRIVLFRQGIKDALEEIKKLQEQEARRSKWQAEAMHVYEADRRIQEEEKRRKEEEWEAMCRSTFKMREPLDYDTAWPWPRREDPFTKTFCNGDVPGPSAQPMQNPLRSSQENDVVLYRVHGTRRQPPDRAALARRQNLEMGGREGKDEDENPFLSNDKDEHPRSGRPVQNPPWSEEEADVVLTALRGAPRGQPPDLAELARLLNRGVREVRERVALLKLAMREHVKELGLKKTPRWAKE